MAFVRRTATALFLRRLPYVTISMQQLQVVDLLIAPLSLRDDMIDFERVAFDEIQPTRLASAPLQFEESRYAWPGCGVTA